MDVPEAMACVKKELATFLKTMSDVPGIEEYRREMAELQSLGRKCDELLALTAQQEQMHRESLRANAEAQAAEAAKAALPEAPEAAPYFTRGQALDPAEMNLVIQRLLQSLPDSSPSAQRPALGNAWELESVDWKVDNAAPEPPPQRGAPPPQPAKPPASKPAADDDKSIGQSIDW